MERRRNENKTTREKKQQSKRFIDYNQYLPFYFAIEKFVQDLFARTICSILTEIGAEIEAIKKDESTYNSIEWALASFFCARLIHSKQAIIDQYKSV